MRHDYDLPPEWGAMTPEERDQWFHRERCRRQSLQQETAFKRHYETQMRRLSRREQARSTHWIGRGN